jgi:hypothetical protein
MRNGVFLFLLILSACSAPPEKAADTYEDIRGFFEAEAIRLSKADPTVKKTVARNDATETRSVSNIDWKTELSLFAESDINKPAWQDSYKVTVSDTSITYVATDTTLKTREIQISKGPDGNIRRVSIQNNTHNMLYASVEYLVYIPDSLYQIRKEQTVVLVGSNTYLVKAIFIK